MKRIFTIFLLISLLKTYNLFSQCTQYTSSNSGLSQDWVTEVTIDSKGKVWVGTSLGGLSIFDGSNWVTYTESNSQLPYYRVTDIEFDSKGNAWIGTGKGLAKFDGSNWTIYNTSNSILPGNDITAIGIDANDKIWIASKVGSFDNKNVVTFDGTNWASLSALPTNADGDQMNGFVFDGGKTWIATDAGVLLYENDAYTFYPKASTGIWSTDAIVKDPNGDIWFAGFHGLLKRSGSSWHFIDHETAFDFPQNTPYYTLIPDGNFLWISYYSGLMKFNKGTETAQIFDYTNSCLPQVNNFSKMARDSKGIIWIGSDEGLIKFDASLTTSVTSKQLSNAAFNLFPNPAMENTKLTVEIPANIKTDENIKFKITDITGKLRSDGIINKNNPSIDASNLIKGSYLIELSGNGFLAIKHLVIN